MNGYPPGKDPLEILLNKAVNLHNHLKKKKMEKETKMKFYTFSFTWRDNSETYTVSALSFNEALKKLRTEEKVRTYISLSQVLENGKEF